MIANRVIAICMFFWVFLVLALPPALAHGSASPHLAAVINLEKLLGREKTANVDAGAGVTLELAAFDDGWRQDLTILADGQKLETLEGGRFIACARLEAGPVLFWAISEFTGGAHCCGVFAFLVRAAAGQPVRFLGETTGYNGGPRDFPGSFIYRQGLLYFESFDNRFDYFHASHAESLLVNVPSCFYRLTPTALTIDNPPFKDIYLQEAAAVDRQIQQQVSRRQAKPQALLQPGFLQGFDDMVFSDTLGQLLVKRTILYLYAREDREAWETFKRDVSRNYVTTAWLLQLQQEIIKVMGQHPY